MPKIVTPQELDAVVALVAAFPGGAGLDDIMQAVPPQMKMTRRTLQRRLAELVDSGRIIKEGELKGSKYRGAPAPGTPTGTGLAGGAQVTSEIEAYVPISSEGRDIKDYVRAPRQHRRPVSYNLAFLEQYYPNHTHYLPEHLRTQLHIMGRSTAEDRPAGTFAHDILNRLLIDLSWASSRLEGNTYSRLDTERLIEFGQAAAGKDAQETQMILNHKSAIEYLVGNADQIGFSTQTIIELHALLSDSLMPDPAACGRLRRRPVEIGGSVYLPMAIPQRVEEIFGLVVNMASEIEDPFEQAFFIMVHLPYLQPFEDVNKRVSRLSANIPFIKHNLSPLSFLDLPERAYVDALLGVYELNRIELLRDVFVSAYERSCQQYVAVRQHLATPEPFRLRYRTALAKVIRAIVQDGKPASEETIRLGMPPEVAKTDRDHFVSLVLNEFRTLHEGNAVRFGLRPLEYAAWKETNGQGG